jgi:hypothetical protein
MRSLHGGDLSVTPSPFISCVSMFYLVLLGFLPLLR